MRVLKYYVVNKAHHFNQMQHKALDGKYFVIRVFIGESNRHQANNIGC